MNRLSVLLITGAMTTMIATSAQQIPDAATDPRIDHQVQQFLLEVNKDSSPFWTLPGPQVRATLTGLQNKYPADTSGVTITDQTITQDDRKVKIYIMKPEHAKGTLPVLFFVHGGVWIAGDFENHKGFVRDLVLGSNTIAVFPEYTPIPDAVFPTQIEECYAALKWTAAHGHEIGADRSRIVIAGNSVGGDMTAVLTMLARERGGPTLKAQILFWPATDASVDSQSYHDYATGRFLSRDFMKFGWDIYVPKEEQRNDPHVSPLRASLEQLSGLPPALVQTEENDVLRDEGEAYARKLDQAGVNVIATRYIGQIHDFGLLNGLRNVPSTQAALQQASDFIKASVSK
jgi:acetyl esterase/lipase